MTCEENMTYEDKFEIWLNETLNPEEAEQLENEIKLEIQRKLEAKEMIDKDEISFLREMGDYEEDEITEIGRHGWYCQSFIVHVGDKSYRGWGWFNDMYGDEFEEQVLTPVELREVKTMKWVEI